MTAKLSDLFEGSSQVTQMMALQEGVGKWPHPQERGCADDFTAGFGRVNVSFLFKAVDAQLPKNMLGWETGTVELLSDITIDTSEGEGDRATPTLHLSTNDSEYKVSSRSAHIEGSKIIWDIGDEDIRLPVYNRFANALHFEIGGTGINPLAKQPGAVAVLWLRDLVDGEEKESVRHFRM